MNERIRQLAEQAGIYKLNLSDETEYWIMEKFAELIVRECIDNVSVWENDSRNHISYMLKNHFGVTE
jgi:hypothetical protein